EPSRVRFWQTASFRCPASLSRNSGHSSYGGSRLPPSFELRRTTRLQRALRTSVICPTGKSASVLFVVCPDPARKIFRFARRANHLYQLAPSRLDNRGVSRSSRTRGGMRGTRIEPMTNGAIADGE